jgi:hypothetical protein
MSMKKDRAAHEIPIAYPDEQRALFLSPKGNLSIYPKWHRKGIQAKTGNFPAMVAKKYFRDIGFKVIVAPKIVWRIKPWDEGADRRKMDDLFGRDMIEKVRLGAEKLGLRGGDPDLFVYRDSGPSDYRRFFVEVKMPPDRTRASQKAVFQLYERYLAPVHVACVQSFSRWIGRS